MPDASSPRGHRRPSAATLSCRQPIWEPPMLDVEMISAGYGPVRILHSVSLDVRRGEILALVGRNGAGKTTTLKAIMGLVRLQAGEIRMAGKVISTLPAHRIAAEGIGYVPQGRRLFAELTVRDNLLIGLM